MRDITNTIKIVFECCHVFYDGVLTYCGIKMTILTSPIFCVATTMLYVVTIQVFAEIEMPPESRVKSSFVNMLNNIVKANEKRMDALKKITELQDYMVSRHRMFNDEPEASEESAENDNAIIALLDVMHNHTYRREEQINDLGESIGRMVYLPTSNAKIDNEDTYPAFEKYALSNISSHERYEDDKLNTDVNEKTSEGHIFKSKILDTLQKEFRRRGYMNTCNKAAAKACRQACVNAYKSFCRIYSCSSRAKKTFKTECRYSCKSKFKSNKYSDTE